MQTYKVVSREDFPHSAHLHKLLVSAVPGVLVLDRVEGQDRLVEYYLIPDKYRQVVEKIGEQFPYSIDRFEWLDDYVCEAEA